MKGTQYFVVTGCSKGIGKALVELLLSDPTNKVLGISRSEVTFNNPCFAHIRMDLTASGLKPEILMKIFPDDPFDSYVLINNAGTIGDIAHFGHLSNKGIQDVLELNATVPAILMNAFVERYASTPNAKKAVVNISSGAANKTIDGWAMYSASKSAINAISLTAQEESKLSGNGIRFFALAPGVVDTDMQESIRGASEASFSQLGRFKDLKDNQKLSKPSEVAEKIIYLLDHLEEFPEVVQDVRSF